MATTVLGEAPSVPRWVNNVMTFAMSFAFFALLAVKLRWCDVSEFL